ncbi:MAG: Prefoldin subunit alpha [Methanomassiliicoccales archaeon PtaU1.Bin124]|nr:MAG: Prefoldin subunit alpha [Methanomassiliicoccales archaeon PtaU1.Bin124]
MNEQELRQALGAVEVYKAQLEGILEQQQLVQMSLEELSRGKATVSEFMKAAEGDEVLVPVGGGSFVRARVEKNQSILVNVGSGISVEKTAEEAMQLMDARAQEMMDAMKKLSESRQVIEMKSAQLNQMLQSEYERMGGQPM